MSAGVSIPSHSNLALLQAEWIRLGIEKHIVSAVTAEGSHQLTVTTEAQAWMPDFDTLELAETLKLDGQNNDDDLRREIWLAMLNSPMAVEFPSAEELISAVNIRRNIAHNAARTVLNFDTMAVERPTDCWRYSSETGFVLLPGSPLIESLRKACQLGPDGPLYSFSCARAVEYVVLLSIAEEARNCHPELLQRLQSQWEKKAFRATAFNEIFLDERGSFSNPVPPHYYVPGERVWFRNPDEASEEATGYEGSWVVYMGGGLFSNFWKRDAPYTMLTKCVEIYHWRDSTFRDAEGDLQVDEARVEALMAQTLADPEACSRVYDVMHRLSDPIDVYEGGGSLDGTRESAKLVHAPHCEIFKKLDAAMVADQVT